MVKLVLSGRFRINCSAENRSKSENKKNDKGQNLRKNRLADWLICGLSLLSVIDNLQSDFKI